MKDTEKLSPDAGSNPIAAAASGSIEQVRDALPDDEILYDLAELFKVFGDTTRVKILYTLFESELCVNDIAQCRILKTSKLAKFRREGKTVYYSLDDDHVRSIIALGLEHIAE